MATSRLLPGIKVDDAIAFGAEDDPSRFNMAHMGLRLAQRANGVAKLHGVVSREMFAGLYPGFQPEEVPIGSVTNGVHLPTWAAREMYDVAGDMADWQDLASASEWPAAGRVSSERLWELRQTLRGRLVDHGAVRGQAELAAPRQLVGRARLDRDHPRPGHPDHRLRPARLHLQAADPDAARPGPAEGDPAEPGSTRCRSSSPARRTRPTSTASGSCRRWCDSPTRPASDTASRSCRTTTWAWPRCSVPARTSG